MLKLEDLIETDLGQVPPVLSNIGKAKIKGAELEFHFKLTNRLSGNLSYTRLLTENEETGRALKISLPVSFA
ncbi:MAG: hypothetical protein A2Z47_10095 [Thermodesulfovibrio sp. RBG_19FT_COMBO_42_12]|nr:MAG: hypothetical protein A2Z47_10095 [Thermodesulfovibrio sp. RBG_19FT_COMBO_42_12]